MVGLAAVFFLAFLLSTFGTAAMRCLALQYGWVAIPRPDRWRGEKKALHGGVGFYPPFLLTSIFVLFECGRSEWFSGPATYSPFGYPSVEAGLLAGSLVMFLVGLADDVKQLRPACKFMGQAAAAGLFMFLAGGFPFSGGGVWPPIIDSALTFIWLVGITNATNMLDNMDGLAAGTAAIEAIALVALGFGRSTGAEGIPVSPLVPLGLVLAGVLAGFLVHNRHPASIFMGDSGSLSTGFILAVLSIPGPSDRLPLSGEIQSVAATLETGAAAMAVAPVLPLLVSVMIMAVPVFDTTLVTLTRICRRRSPFQGGVDHASHRMVKLGIPEKITVLCLQFLAAMGGIIAMLAHARAEGSLLVAGFFAAALVVLGIRLARVRV